MNPPRSMMRLLPLLREYGVLERKRVRDGVTPLEYRRWCELDETLSSQVAREADSHGGKRRRHLRVPTRMLVSYRTQNELRQAIVSNISKGGMFISTPLPPEVGTTFVLVVDLDAIGDRIEVPCEVVSTNHHANGKGAGVHVRGMGVKFIGQGAEQRRAVNELFAAALGHESLEEMIAD